MRVLAALPILLVTAAAHADPTAAPSLPTSYSVALMAGYASPGVSIGTGSPNLYQFGFGIRGGVSIPKLYFGAALVQHTGYVKSASGAGSSYESRQRMTTFGPELGYDAHFGRYLFIRPYVGIGAVFVYDRTTVSGVDLNRDRFMFHVTPGFLVGARTGNVVFGVDLRAVLSPINDPTNWAPGAFATIGVAF